ncbi:unnamed protein product [Spirodela intermedia]|uniref:Cupin type-1 domain-containing protein n=1 Tax=Spirodela intermedia TaxID=51605 RepID=A0A7I8JTT4_SPIIN|nr:unnamed protein product [Spirodela intermedia]CAA6673185.1 unnamed protein product [Spirodela intermedia]
MATRSGLSLLSSAVCVLLLSQGCLGQLPFGEGRRRRQTERREWRLERLEAVEPSRRIQAEAGVIEYWTRTRSRLLLPYYSNAPRLVYIIQGQCRETDRDISQINATLRVPGMPETFQSFQQSEPREEERRGESLRDQHQKIHRFREGDVIALPAGVATWFYNDGETPSSPSPSPTQATTPTSSIRHCDRETIRKLQGHDDRRGNIVRSRGTPVREAGETPRTAGRGRGRRREAAEEDEGDKRSRGILCNSGRENIRNPDRADVYSREAGSNAPLRAHWNINAHSILYVTRGRARLQISGNQGRGASFEPRCGGARSSSSRRTSWWRRRPGARGFEWVSFKTEDFPLVSPLAGRRLFSAACRRASSPTLPAVGRGGEEGEARRGEEFLVFRPRAQGGRVAAA